MEELAAGNLDLVSSDHCGYDAETRALGQNNFTLIPQGVTGVQERLGVVYQKGVVESSLPMTKFVEVTSSKAAKLLNLFPQKGHIGEGSDADIVIWSKDAGSTPSTIKGGEFNIFSGLSMLAGPEIVIFGGKIVVAEKQMNAPRGQGRFIEAWPSDY